jgi:hypothetical protein
VLGHRDRLEHAREVVRYVESSRSGAHGAHRHGRDCERRENEDWQHVANWHYNINEATRSVNAAPGSNRRNLTSTLSIAAPVVFVLTYPDLKPSQMPSAIEPKYPHR